MKQHEQAATNGWSIRVYFLEVGKPGLPEKLPPCSFQSEGQDPRTWVQPVKQDWKIFLALSQQTLTIFDLWPMFILFLSKMDAHRNTCKRLS